MKKFKWGRFLVTLSLVLVILGGIVLGGYFVLDKAVVPRYFGEYGIYNMNELVGMMRTLYSTPHESQIITNGFLPNDFESAKEKLIAKNYPIKADGSFDFERFNKGERGDGDVFITDRELASVLDKLLESKEFSDLLPDLVNFDTLNISVKEVSISLIEQEGDQTEPDGGVQGGDTVIANSAHIKFIALIDTNNVRGLMSEQMQIPLFLLNMIIPKTMYITLNYNVTINSGAENPWSVTDGGLAVNGSTEKQSEVLLNLLIKFIFGEETSMTPTQLLSDLADIIEQGVDLFGDIQFTTKSGSIKNQTGIYLLPTNASQTQPSEPAA